MDTLFKCPALYNQKFGFNVIPLEGKKPSLRKWKHLQNQKQTTSDGEKLNWRGSVNGVAGVNGVFHSLDFDKCNDKKLVFRIADELGVNTWIVKTGFGFHIHFFIPDISIIELKWGIKSNYRFDAIDKSLLDHCELRIKDCYTTLPPSKHYSGKNYEFLTGFPESPPQEVSAKTIIDFIQKYFIVRNKEEKQANSNARDEVLQYLSDGATQGSRHQALTKIFGLLFHKDFDKDFITAQINNWNIKNRPPIDSKELSKQLNDLWNRYSNGRDNVFYQFHNCLLGLNDNYELLLLKILSYGILEFDGDKSIVKTLNIKAKLKTYHKECKKYVQYFEDQYGKDQILRIGKNIFLETLSDRMTFDEFSIYCAITSWLGRKKVYDTIANSILYYRAIGFKCEADYLIDEKCLKKPISYYQMNKARGKLKQRKLIDYGSPIKGRMNYYSTRIKDGDAFPQQIKANIEKKLLQKKKTTDSWASLGETIRVAKKNAS